MIYKYFTTETFESATIQLAETLASMPTQAFALTKQALNASMQNTLEQQLQLEDNLQYQAAHTKDYQEGVTAFLQKRAAHFTGE
jgi:2-(1,2-epoxy-1,2-dihydrophenyl)acetyl-CoA isomerase